MSLRNEQCNKVCRILDDVLANRPTERDSLITAARKAFGALETEPQWIPCSNKLPGDEDWYLVTVHPDYVYPNSRATDTLYWREGKWWYINDGFKLEVFPDPIIAWMELPEPYERQENEK